MTGRRKSLGSIRHGRAVIAFTGDSRRFRKPVVKDQALIYVSTRRLAGDRVREVDDIVAVSRGRNAMLGVTGAIVATPTSFAQILEGPKHALAELMASITRDARHHDIRMIDLGGRATRDFPDWSLAFSGQSSYISHVIAEIMEEHDFDFAKSVNRLYFIIRKFVEPE